MRRLTAFAGLLLLSAALAGTGCSRQPNASRVYRIGWHVDPPFQLQGNDGQPEGPAIDVVREAARRRGIRLEWVYTPDFSLEALGPQGKLDFWVLLTIRPERLGRVYITDPYLVTEHCLLVRADSRFREVADLASAAVSFHDRPILLDFVRELLPSARPVLRATSNEPVEDVCAGRADAAYFERHRAMAALLSGSSCSGTPLRWIPSPGKRSLLGIGSSIGLRRVADSLREEIGSMAGQNQLHRLSAQWGYLSGMHLEYVEELMNASRRERWFIAGICASIALVLLAACQTIRLRADRVRLARAEQAQQESEQQLRLLTDSLNDMVLAYDMQRRLTYANPAVQALTGYSVEEMTRSTFINWIHPVDQDRMTGYWDGLFRGESYEDQVYRLVTKDGRSRWASATWGPMLDRQGNQVGVKGCERDITAQKEAEEALRASEWRFRHLLENVQFPCAIVDLQGRLQFCNACLLQILGWSREELLGQSVTEIFPLDAHPRLRAILDRTAAGEQPEIWENDAVLLTRSGTPRQLKVSNVLLRNSDGSILGIACVAVDVTNHNTLQEQYLQAQKMESVGRLAGGVAHDFNNLLTLINGYSELLLQQDPDNDALLEIRSAGERASMLTRQLLAFSRKNVSAPSSLDLNALVTETASMLRRLIGSDVELVCDLHPDIPLVMADPGQLQQLLMNLAVNARDAMPGGGRLAISTRSAKGPGLTLAVTDSGHGMSEEVRSRIFEPFFTTKPAGKGTGLGLAIVYSVVQQANGRLRVESEPGKGTSFHIFLPASQESGTVASNAVPTPDLSGSETILLVEDQPSVRAFTSAVLTSYGYRVIEMSSPTDALSLVLDGREQIDALVSDVVMPHMSGRELARRVSAIRPGIRVLLMSGYDTEASTADATTPLLHKPFSPVALGARIKAVLRDEELRSATSTG